MPAGPDSSSRSNGVLPNISNAQGGGKPVKAGRSKSKVPHEGVKLKIRYLPPGLKESECVDILGDTWKVGSGKVDWFRFDPGKASRRPGKPSTPSLAYVRLIKQDLVTSFSEFVRSTIWEDASETSSDPSLLFPPYVERCSYQKTPSEKQRLDPRAGTIDQETEFMNFLEELTSAKETQPLEPGEPGEALKEGEKPVTTPLIEFLKAKKAAKEKEAASAKIAKQSRQESKSARGKTADESRRNKDKTEKIERGTRSEKGRGTVKILTKKATTEGPSADTRKSATNQPAASSSSSARASSTSTTSAQPPVADEPPKSRRTAIAAAARILQRDLGLSPGSAHRRARHEVVSSSKTEAETKQTGESKGHSAKTILQTPQETKSKGAPQPQSASSAPPTPSTVSAAPNGPSSSKPRGRGSRGEGKGKSVESVAGQTSASPSTSTAPISLLKKRPEPSVPPSSKPAAGPTEAQPSKVAANPPRGSKAEKPPRAQKSATTATPSAARGFVKHANLSQGITEALLKQSLGVFGTVTFVEIDKRKGFAYVDFADSAGLAKAISASPITIAEGAVQVLERREKKAAAPTQAGPSSGSGSAPAAAKPSTSTAASGSQSAEKPEKSTQGRSRRGRRGGEKTASSSNGNAGQPSTPTAG